MNNTKQPTPFKVSTKPNLTPKERKFVNAIVQGKSKRSSGLIAGAKTPISADKYANRLSKNVKIAQAIENALEASALTPELAVKELRKIVVQDEELGAKRLAIKDALELHGWQRGDKPNITLDIQNASFFNQARPSQVLDQQDQ